MNPRNGLTWLSSSSAAITRARSVLDALRKPGVIDELGFLMLNGAFAERLYPAVTTIMTRARYLIFVPAIYRYLERSGRAEGKDADRVSRDVQFDLRNALAKTEQSFIGKDGGRGLVRVPSNVYWSALGTLGIATRRISEATYLRQLSDGAFRTRVLRDDDDASHDEEVESLWSPDLGLGHVLPDGQFPAGTSFDLRKTEAAFLRSRYGSLVPEGRENLVSRMVSLGLRHGASSLEGIKYPWTIPDCTAEMSKVLDHARRLSLMARGATLQYYRMLIEKRGDDDPGVESAFVDWWEQAREDLLSWDLSTFFGLMLRWGAGRTESDRRFITSWIARCRATERAQSALADPEARARVSGREDWIRPGKQRLRVKFQLERWKLPEGFAADIYQMDYRHRVGRQISIDIAEGIERGNQ